MVLQRRGVDGANPARRVRPAVPITDTQQLERELDLADLADLVEPVGFDSFWTPGDERARLARTGGTGHQPDV